MDDSLKRNEQDLQTEENEDRSPNKGSLENEELFQKSPNEKESFDFGLQRNNEGDGEWESFDTSDSIDAAIKDLPEVLGFVQNLQQCILHQRTLIHKLYYKLKERGLHTKTTKDANTQTSEEDIEVWTETTETGNLIEDIKKAAENAVQQTGFVYEATSGMYYDYNTGYYYNAELGLYYEGNSGTYYYFDESSKSFQFHSQLESSLLPSQQPQVATETQDDQGKKRHRPSKVVSESCDNAGVVEIAGRMSGLSLTSQYLSAIEIASAWPPCLRVVVKQTTLDNLVVGSLFIVTCTGGTLGRVGDHAITIPDINISKHHARVNFSEQEQCYQLIDLGSRNGTFVDGHRVSVALRESDPVCLKHGTQVRVGVTTLECHLHPGRETCQDCEPGCAIRNDNGKQEADIETREARHRSELRRLRKRFGLDKLTIKEKEGSLAPGYQDRAEERRKTVGSQNPHAKTETASVHQSIQSNNKGFKMLAKMGWSKGQALGKDSAKGITEPVLVEQRPDKAGLGADVLHLPAVDPQARKKAELWKKAQKRFQELDDEDD